MKPLNVTKLRQLSSILILLLLIVACSDSSPPTFIPDPPKPPDINDVSITGTIVMPDGEDVLGSIVGACFEGDCDSSNTKSVKLTQSGQSAGFSITGLTAGKYSVVALKDVNNNQTFDEGDYSSNVVEVTAPATNVRLNMVLKEDDGGNGGDDGTCSLALYNDITIPTVLTNGPNECDYIVMNHIEVTSKLVVEPGVVIKFKQDTRLMIDDAGSITAVGTPDARIRFEGELAVKGFWYGFCFGTNRESRLEYVDILWGGKVWTGGSKVCRAAIGGVSSNGEPIHIKNTLIAGAYTTGLDAVKVRIGEFSNNVFADNEEYGVRVGPWQIHKLDTASDYLGSSIGKPNSIPYVFIGGYGYLTGSEFVWPNLNIPYYSGDDGLYSDHVSVNGNDYYTTVVIEPGTRFEFGPEGGIFFYDGAGLKAIGTSDNPIVFTGRNQTKGSWDSLTFSDAGPSTLDHVEISYGGADSSIYVGNVVAYGVYSTDLIVITNSIISNSATCGITDTQDLVQQSNNTFSGNNWYDLCY